MSLRWTIAAAAAAILLCLPAGAWAHHATDGAKHQAEDSVIHTPAEEARLQRLTAAATRDDAARAAAAVVGDEHQVGRWGPVTNWPVVGVHVALMPNGKVLAYDSVGDNPTESYPVHNFTRATVWDPATGTHTRVDVDTGFNIFCSGLGHLPDGSLFLAGGNKNAALDGIRQTHTFNTATNTWSRGQDMAYERWYPSVTPLSNGEMLITEGGPDIPEVRGTNGTLRQLSGAGRDLPNYPWLDVAPDGRAFFSGPEPAMYSLNATGAGAWQSFGDRDNVNRGYGSRAMYDVGKVLVSGGGPSVASARVIDVNGATPQVSTTAPMAVGRRQHNLTVLADGSVLATGGLSSGADLVDLNAGVLPAERWNPATGQWSTLAPMAVTRQYHSTALLLPDGRVLSSGGGICGTCKNVGYLAKNAEVFTPPYLFKTDGSGDLAPRPAITSAPSAVNYGGQVRIATPNAASISRVALVRLGSVTHSVNMEQRFIPLSINARDSGRLRATGPANANIAPPGPYMLFVIDAAGVPSVARMVTVAAGTPPANRDPVAVAAANPSSGTAPLSVSFDGRSSNDPDGDPLSYSWDFGDGGTSSAAAPAHTYSAPGDYTARLTVSDGLGGSSTATTEISVRDNPPPNRDPVAVLDARPSSGVIPLDVGFDGRGSSDPDGDPLSYSWSFGDGATSSAAAPAHRYAAPGTYTARLTVSDGRGGSATATTTISVRAPDPPDPDPPDPGGPGPGGPGPGPGGPGPGPGGPGPGGPPPGGSDTSGPTLRLLGVNAARGRIRGRAADPAGVEAVSVALRRKLPGGGCRWWLEGKRKMSSRRRCDRPRWMEATLSPSGDGVRWLLRLRRALGSGSYRVLARATDGEGNETRLPVTRASLARVD